MTSLEADYRVIAIDQRGYNGSGQPAGVENYTLEKLGSDVAAVVAAQDRSSATIVGHDWGGAVAWTVAMTRPEIVDNLIILNLPHPRGLARELANSEAQQRASQYAFNFQQPNAHTQMSAEMLVAVSQSRSSDIVKQRYLEAFQSFEHGIDAELLQGELPKTGRGVSGKLRGSGSSGVDVPRLEGHCTLAWRIERHVELDKQHTNARDDSRSRPLGSA